MKINKCVCHDVSFEEVSCIADQHNIKSIEDLGAHIQVCNTCQMCKPYLEEVLKTGQTEFYNILPADN